MKRKKRTALSLLLSLALVMSFTPGAAFAVDEGENSSEEKPVHLTMTEQGESGSAIPNVKTEDSDELLLQYLEKKVDKELADAPLPEGAKKRANKQSRGSKLSGNNLIIYNQLVSRIQEAASGKLDSTSFSIKINEAFEKTAFSSEELGVEEVLIPNPDWKEGDSPDKKWIFDSNAVDNFVEKFNYAPELIVDSLLADMPYELYWFDKTKTGGYSYGQLLSYEFQYINDTEYIAMDDNAEITFEFKVSSDYSMDGEQNTTSLNTEKTSAASDFAANTASIITDNENKSDLEKLTAYKDAICEAVSYDHYAADDNNHVAYGDPWQMIWVFDTVTDDQGKHWNTDTKVVCEGYSKAFQFLCDKSRFIDQRIECDTVTGTMGGGTGGGDHMWNILHMDDGKNYIADITNCDGSENVEEESNTIGYPDLLFLKGAVAGGSVDAGYGYDCIGDDSADITYTYDEDSKSLFSNEELTMSEDDYEATECEHVWDFSGITWDYSNEMPSAIAHYTCRKVSTHNIDKEAKVVIKSEITPTCERAGSITYEATVSAENSPDGESHSDSLTVDTGTAPHTMTAHAAKAPTYSEEGNSAYWSCSSCGKFFSDENGETAIEENSWVIPAKTPEVEPDDSSSSDAEDAAKKAADEDAAKKAADAEAAAKAKAEEEAKAKAKAKAKAEEEAKAKAEEERLEWEGTLSSKIPAAKSVKVKAGSGKVTVSWKKADKNKAKNFDKIEVQVCTDKKFRKANTKRKEVKKSKKNVTVKGMKKSKTYWVRVRNVKGRGSKKQVSKWSKPKKCRIK